jgi:hypothetical protein
MAYDEPEPLDEADAPAPQSTTNGKAITALILGVLSFCLPVLLSIPAIILGILGLVDAKDERRGVRGRGLAITGIVLGSLSMIVTPFVMMALLVPAVAKVREAAARTQDQNNLKQIGMAFHSYHDVNKAFPPPTVYDKQGRPLYSWRVLLLPYLEENNMYNMFHLNEPWDSPHNMQFLKLMPDVYFSPLDPEEDRKAGVTRYQVFVAAGQEQGPRPAFINMPRPELDPFHSLPGPRLVDFTDGISNTILVAAGAKAVPWTKPEELVYSNRGPLPALARHSGARTSVLLADMSVRAIDLDQISEQTLRNAITINDNQALGPDW